MRLTESDPKACEKFMAQHQEKMQQQKMQQRAKAKGIDAKDRPTADETD